MEGYTLHRKKGLRRYEAGVYLIRSRKNSASYVGSSMFLTGRVNTHLGQIISGRKASAVARLFGEHSQDELEFRILERCEVVRNRDKYDLDYLDKKFLRARRRMLDRERFWISELKPSVNRRGRTKRINVDELPVGID